MSSTASSGAQAPSTVVIYSGGMDSYTVLHRALREGLAVHALSFDYGQRHRRELDVARQVCESLAIPHQVVDIRAIHGLIDNSALTNAALTMPQGEYDADSLHSTVVPNRNMILLSLAIAKAVNIGANRVDYGAHGGDHILEGRAGQGLHVGTRLLAGLVRICARFALKRYDAGHAHPLPMTCDAADTMSHFVAPHTA